MGMNPTHDFNYDAKHVLSDMRSHSLVTASRGAKSHLNFAK